MLKRTLISVLTLTLLATAPATAGAADTVLVPGAEAQRMTALQGNVVWVTGDFPRQTLMRRDPGGTVAPVKGAPKASYRSIDLGITRSGRLVLTYIRCAGNRRCKAISDNLKGRRASYKRLAPKRCEVSTAPSRWRGRVAYGLSCDRLRGKPNVHDARRSGLFARKGGGAAKRLRLPRRAVEVGNDNVRWVDLRGINVGAVASDIAAYGLTQTVNGSRLRFTLVGLSEGESDQAVKGVSLGFRRSLWTLVDSIHVGDPNETLINRLGALGCEATQTLVNPPEGIAAFEGFVAEAMAVDGDGVFLYKAGIGIVRHDFEPSTTRCP